MKRILTMAGAASALALLAAAATPASASTFFSFGADQPKNFYYTEATDGGSFSITGYTTYSILAGPYAGFSDYGTVDITGTTTDALQINGGGSFTLNGFSGTISLGDAEGEFAGPIFTGTYSGASLYIAPGSASLGGNAIYDEYLNPTPATIAYSSSYIPVNLNLGDSFSIDLSDLSGLKFKGRGATLGFQDFNGVAAGSFASNSVPEPAAWAVMLLGFGAVGGMMRRRRVVATAA